MTKAKSTFFYVTHYFPSAQIALPVITWFMIGDTAVLWLGLVPPSQVACYCGLCKTPALDMSEDLISPSFHGLKSLVHIRAVDLC